MREKKDIFGHAKIQKVYHSEILFERNTQRKKEEMGEEGRRMTQDTKNGGKQRNQ